MDQKVFKVFAETIALPYMEREDLSRHTSFRIGGAAEVFAEPETVEQIQLLVHFCREQNIRLRPLGKGSNILVPDEGISDIVLHFGHRFSKIELLDENTIYCEAGTSLGRLCRFALEQGLSGLEFAYGIPGSVGGAVYMNAGAYGGEIKDVILFADHVDKNGDFGRFSGDELAMSYRHSVYSGSDYYITGAAFRLQKADRDEISARMEELIAKRYEKQPMEKPSAGSTFKRPEGAFASALIDQCGLKGFQIGGAAISTKHAGFVVNEGGATCDDVLRLMEAVSQKVKEDTGFVLEPEVEIWRE